MAMTRPIEYLTTREVAEYFRTAESTVRYWRMKGYGPASTKVGRRVLYRVADIEAFESQLRQDASVGCGAA